MNNIDGIIFDIDGTIWDIRSVVADAWSDAIKKKTKLEVNFNAETLGSLFGKPMDEIFHMLYPKESIDTMENIIPILYEYEHKYIRDRKPQAYDNVKETLSILSKKYPLYIVTNAQKGYVEEMFYATGLEKYFKGWLCYGDTLASKDVTMRKLISKYNLESPVYIGDTKGDEDACIMAVVPFIYAKYGLGEVQNPKYFINDVKELVDMFM